MKAFDYNSFADLTLAFELKKGEAVPPKPKARVILYTSTALQVTSRFVKIEEYRPAAKELFIAAARKRVVDNSPPSAPVVAMPAPEAAPEQDVSLITPAAAVVESEAPRPRGTLRLKKKVELPPIITRRSTMKELAAAFRAETAQGEKSAAAPLSLKGSNDLFRKKRHPLSSKPWSELIAEAEASLLEKRQKAEFDLGAAFKAEMKAFNASQARIAASEASAPRPQLKLAA